MESATLESSENDLASFGDGDLLRNPGDRGLGEGVLRTTGGLCGGDTDLPLLLLGSDFF